MVGVPIMIIGAALAKATGEHDTVLSVFALLSFIATIALDCRHSDSTFPQLRNNIIKNAGKYFLCSIFLGNLMTSSFCVIIL